MATKIPLPGTGESIDAGDPMDWVKTPGKLVVGGAILTGIMTLAVSAWNTAADSTGQETVEIF